MVGIKKLSKLLTITLLLTITSMVNAQDISPLFFGQNSWMPDSTGTRFLNGRVHETWQEIEESGAQSIRFGGISSDRDMPTNHQYLRMIDSIRNRGMEPIIQVSYWKGRYSAKEAGDLVDFINKQSGRNIKYWSIGNEPDHGSSYGFTKAEEVAPYLKEFSIAMKAADPSIKIIGPDCAWYNRQIIPPLVTPGGPHDVTGKSPDGHYYIDIISFHEYPFKGTQSREQVIKNLTSNGRFEDRLIDLKERIEKCNTVHGRTGDNAITMGVTEANIGYHDPKKNGVEGLGTEGFIGGQFWVEMLGIAMKHSVEFVNFWGVTNALGYLEKYTHKKRPTYYHFQMMSQNFRGQVADAKTNMGNVKTFASKDTDQIAVIVMNQSNSSDMKFTLRLNNDEIEGSEELKINVDAGLGIEHKDEIGKNSTILYVFNNTGALVKKCEYSMELHALKDLPPSCTEIATPPTAAITAPVSVICEDEEIVMVATEGENYTYQWFKNGEEIKGATEFVHATDTAGTFTVQVTRGDASAISEPFEIVESDGPDAEITPDGDLNICETMQVILRAEEGPEHTYTWILNDVDIPASNTPEYEASIPGEYKVKISNPCGEQVSAPVYVTTCNGIAQTMMMEEQDSRELHSYPNPNDGYFTVEMQTEELVPGEVVVLEVLNMAGQVVYKFQPNQVNGHLRQVIEMDPSFPAGVYILRVRAGQQSFTNKILVSR